MNLGIIIPYRSRAEHLQESSPVLRRYGKVYVIEQMGRELFNRGKLINIGYKEFKKEFDYFAAHDVDMIPENANYAYANHPCHLATEAEQFGYRMPYPDFFGGVTLFPNDKFEKINGFPNTFFGWGGEDDEIRRRFIDMGETIQSRQCRFRSLDHIREIDRQARLKNIEKLKAPIDWEDGLTSCKYEVVRFDEKENYTLLQVRL